MTRQTAPTPAATPAPSGAAASQTAVTQVPPPGGPYTAREMYDAAQMHRRIVRDQLSSVVSQRDDIARQLREPSVVGVNREGLEGRLKVLDIQVLDLQQQLSDAQLRESQAAAVPGATQRTQAERDANETEAMLTIGLALVFVVALPLTIAYARRLWKKHSVTFALSPELTTRLDSIDRAVESTAIEVERIGEGQRFVTQLLAQRAAPAPVPLPPTTE